MDRRKLIYIGSLLILIVIVSVTYFSYAFFTNKSEQRGKINVVAGTLNYNVKGKGLSNNSITIPGNTTKKIELTLESINTIDSKYELYYETTSNDIEVGYSSDTTDSTTGTIEAKGKKKITIFITNPTSSNITVTFNAEGGFTGNTLERTLGKEIPSQESICENYSTYVFNFDYTGNEQEFISPCSGTYTLETWGAQGGSNPYASYSIGGYGGYSTANIVLNDNSKIYLQVGEIGKSKVFEYNGGGNGAPGGGGATSITTSSRGELSNFENHKSEILIVSGGGGGDDAVGYGGAGGGFKGDTSSYIRTDVEPLESRLGYGGTQTAGGLGYENGTFGKGGSFTEYAVDHTDLGGAGGGGYYGGGAGQNPGWSSGGGGSGYIGNSDLTNKAMYCYDCEESMDVDTYTISTTNSHYMEPSSECPNGYSSDPISKCAKAGNGYARITYYGTNTTKVTYDYNYLPNDLSTIKYGYDDSSYIVWNYPSGAKRTEFQKYDDNFGLGYIIAGYSDTNAVNTSSHGFYIGKRESLEIGKKYTLSIEVKTSESTQFRIYNESASGSNNWYVETDADENWKRITLSSVVTKTGGTITFYGWVRNNPITMYIRNFQIQEGDPYTMDRSYVKGGTLSDIETPKRNGWTFDGWWTDPIGGTQITSSTTVPNSNTTYYAHWTLNNQ